MLEVVGCDLAVRILKKRRGERAWHA
jgi:hypothetical protein